MKFILLGIFIFYFILISAAQSLKGVARNADGAAMPDVNFVLYKIDSLTILKFSQTGDDGAYSMDLTGAPSNCLVAASALGFRKAYFSIKDMQKGDALQHDFVLTKINLGEVVIRAKAVPVTESSDTTTYRADSFTDGSERNVEDLLKKLPGIKVKEDGTVYAKGKLVEKIMLDGEDLLGKNYKILTKNVPANLVDKVQTIDHFSESRIFKGIQNSDAMAMNLTIKTNRKKFIFGNANISAGTDERYDENLNIFSFTKKIKSYWIAGADNVGHEPLNGDYCDIGEAFQAMGIEKFSSDHSHIIATDNPNFYTPLERSRTNVNRSVFGNANLIFNPSAKSKLKVTAIGYGDRFLGEAANDVRYFSDTAGLRISEQKRYEAAPVSGFLKLDYHYFIDSVSELQYILNGNIGKNDVLNAVSTNTNDRYFNTISEKIAEKTYSFGNEVNYSRRVSRSQALFLDASFKRQSDPQDYEARYAAPAYFLSGDSFHYLRQNANLPFSEGAITASLLGALRKDKYSIQTGVFANDYALRSGLQTQDSELKPQTLGAAFENAASFRVNNYFVKGEYVKKWRSLSLETSVRANAAQTSYNDLAQKNYFFLEPRIAVDLKLSKHDLMRAACSQTARPASIVELYQGYILSDYRTLSRGASESALTASPSFALFFTHSDYADHQWNLFANAFFRHSDLFYATNITLRPAYSLVEKVLLKDADNRSFNFQTDKYIPILSAKLELEMSASSATGKNLLNHVQTNSVYSSQSIRFGYGSAFDGFVNFGGGIQFQNAGTRLEKNSVAFENHTTKTNFYVSFRPGQQFSAKISGDRLTSQTLGKSFFFLDARLSYAPKKDKMNFDLIANNLLNLQNFEQYSASDISETRFSQKILGRYIMLKMQYGF